MDITMGIDTTGQDPRIGVVICDCGDKIAGVLDTEALRQKAAGQPGVEYAARDTYPCSKDGQERICKAIQEYQLNRLLVAGCSPRMVDKLYHQAVQSTGLDPSYLNVINIREHVAYIHPDDPAAAAKASSMIEMGIARLAMTAVSPAHTGQVVKAALVIGSGLSALTVALALADARFQVTLVEPTGALGGSVPDLQERTRELIAAKSQLVLEHPLITTLFNAYISEVTGHPGDYEVRIQYGDQSTTYEIGAIIVDNGAQTKKMGATRWFDREKVKTQAEYETELDGAIAPGKMLEPDNVVMIFCAEETQLERCSRVCCNIGVRQAIRTKQLKPDSNVTILFRELYLGEVGGYHEAEFIEARKLGVTFFRYRRDRPPVIGDKTVDVLDTLTGEPIRVPFERAVLSMPLIPNDNSQTLAALLGLPQDEAGFLAEPRLRLRPGRYADPGIYVLGSAQQPADTTEALFQAYLTSSRTARFLSQDTISVQTPVASIDPVLCTGCGNCPQVCPTLAIHLEKRDGLLSLSEVDELRCIGCGNCVVVCPVKAISLPGWDNIEIPAQISAALQSHANGDVKVIALACEWSADAAAEMAGVQRIPYPPNVSILRMNCSARFDPYHILWAFLNGADGVFLGACPPGQCHYGIGNLYAQERVEKLKNELTAHGVDPDRLCLKFLTLDNGKEFAQAVQTFVDDLSTRIPHKQG